MEIIVSAIIAWFISQAIKVFIEYKKTKNINLLIFLTSGGMPSSHSAFVTATSFKVAILEGCSTPLFGACVIFSFIVMHDAIVVRQAVGNQARALNKLFFELNRNSGITCETIKEVCGHNLVQVIAGFFVGMITAFLI